MSNAELPNGEVAKLKSEDIELSIAEIVKKTLENDWKIRDSICTQLSGSFEIFVRNGRLGKLAFCEFSRNSNTPRDVFEAGDDIEKELPMKVYRYFCSLVASYIEDVVNPTTHGSIRFNYEFEELENGEWEQSFCMYKMTEIHFDANGLRRQHLKK